MERNELFYKKLNREVKEMLAPVRMGVMILNADGSGDGDILIAATMDELQTMKLHRDENEAALDRELGEGGEGQKCVAYTDFGAAIRAVKKGHRIARKGWNGKNQCVELATHVSYIAADGSPVNVDHDAAGNAALAFVGTSGVQLGWLASQADMLAEDWYILEEAK